jgi:hypothetical protein
MVHLFLLTVLLNGEIVSEDMYFRNIYDCSRFSKAVVQSRSELSRLHEPRTTTITAYCLPKLVDPEGLKVY